MEEDVATKEEIERAAWKRVVDRMIELELTPSIVREALNGFSEEDPSLKKDSYILECAGCSFELEYEHDQRPDHTLCCDCEDKLLKPPEVLVGAHCHKCGAFFDPESMAEHRCSVVCDYCNAYKRRDPQTDGVDQADRGLQEAAGEA